MSRLSDLRAALDELEAAQDGYDPSRPADERQYEQFCRITDAMDRLHDLEDITTIRALVKVAEAAERRRIEEEREYSMSEPMPSQEWEDADAALETALDVVVIRGE